jgi:hypothetical protein
MAEPQAAPQARLYPVSRKHLAALTGELGIFQHAIGRSPDPLRGHAVDDVARTLQVDLLHARTLGWTAVSESVNRSLQFLEDAFDEPTGRFRASRGVDGEWTDAPSTHDGLGRVMLALGETIAAAPDPQVAERAIALFGRAMIAAGRVTTTRAQASVVLACAAITRATAVTASTDERVMALGAAGTALMRRLATGLHARFLDFAQPGWPWPDAALTSENALLPRALIVAGGRVGADVMGRVGLQVLDWLIEVQTAAEGHLSLVGTGTWPQRGEKSQFDQQPIEATALLLGAETAYIATGDPKYLAMMESSYAWFLGGNDLRRQVAQPSRGACSDALTARGASPNQGAEATLMWLMASEHIRAVRSQPLRARIAGPRRYVVPVATAAAT